MDIKFLRQVKKKDSQLNFERKKFRRDFNFHIYAKLVVRGRHKSDAGMAVRFVTAASVIQAK